MKKILFVVTCFFILPVCVFADSNHFYLDTPISGIFTMMDKVTKIAANNVKPVRKVETGEYVYCVTPGIAINPDANYQKITNNPWTYLNISKEKYEKIQAITYFGYMYNNHTDIIWYAITQYLIWQEVMPEGWSVYFTEVLRGSLTHKFDYMINEINYLVNNYLSSPNISSNITGDYKNVTTLYDSNNILNNYISNDNRVSIDNNTLSINPSNDSFDFSIRYNTTNISSDLYIYDDAQWVVSRGTPPNKTYSYHVNILKGDLKIKKELNNYNELSFNANISLNKAKYAVFNDYYYNVFETDENGIINISNLNIDDYYIKEISSPLGLELNNDVYQIHINSNTLNAIKVYDDITISKVNIEKKYLDVNTNEYLPEINASFGILDNNDNLLVSKNTNDNGVVSFNLPVGVFTITQLSGVDRYNFIRNEEIEILDNHPINLYYYNKPTPVLSSNTTTNEEDDETILIEDNIVESEEKEIQDILYIPTEEITDFIETKEYNPRTFDSIRRYLLISICSIIMVSIILLKKFIKKRGFWQKICNI